MVPGLSNFRDCGGLALADRGIMRRGRIFRSAAPGALAPEGARSLAELGIRRVVDLRGRAESAASPRAALEPHGIAVLPTPVEPRTSGQVRAAIADGSASAAGMRALMLEAYRNYVTHHAEAFGEAIVAFVEEPGATLVHCTAGKDRTGFVVALMQRVLGADEADILADYLRTNADWDRASVSGHLPDAPDVLEPILIADADYLAAAFDEIDRQDGSPLAFIGRATRGRVGAAELATFIETGDPA